MHERPATWKKVSAASKTYSVPAIMRSYHLNDDDETDVSPDDIAKGNH